MRPPPRFLRRWTMTGCTLLLAGCTTIYDARFDPLLIPKPAATESGLASTHVLLIIPDAVVQQVALGERLNDLARSRVRMPIGRIVQQTADIAFGEQFDRGAGPPGAVVVLASIDYRYRDDYRYFIPLGPLTVSSIDLAVRLKLAVEVRDPRGHVRWTKAYDSGERIWKPPSPWTGPTEERKDALTRLTHETAALLLRQAACDVRAWLEAERLRERKL